MKQQLLANETGAAAPVSLWRPTEGPARNADLPGDLAIWIFIFAELLVFGVFFAAYGVARARAPVLFHSMQTTLDRHAGMINTLLLILSSWCVVRAIGAVNRADNPAAARWLAGALAGGAGFLVVKATEYADKYADGITLSTNTFYMFYLSLTFFHFMHVILGMVILGALFINTRRGAYAPGHMSGLESGASYWHMVDLVWIVLFPLVYLLQ